MKYIVYRVSLDILLIQIGTGQTQTEYLKKHREDAAARKAAEAAKCAKATPQKPAEKK